MKTTSTTLRNTIPSSILTSTNPGYEQYTTYQSTAKMSAAAGGDHDPPATIALGQMNHGLNIHDPDVAALNVGLPPSPPAAAASVAAAEASALPVPPLSSVSGSVDLSNVSQLSIQCGSNPRNAHHVR
jgi:hypothetical protein